MTTFEEELINDILVLKNHASDYETFKKRATKLVQEKCIDKTKVKKAIDKLLMLKNTPTAFISVEELRKELNLND
jgi:hypothetical protein